MTIEGVILWCARCRADREFETPPCPDGHGPGCPELACTACGEAILGAAAFPELDLAWTWPDPASNVRAG